MVRAISNDNDSTPGMESEFTPNDATKMLPLVRHIADDVLRLSRSIETQREQIREIDQFSETIEQVDYQEELSDIRASLAEDEQRLNDCLRELASLGLQTHEPFDGSIDFPSVMNRRRVQLCWLPEDERVEYWHEIGQTREHRKKIDQQMFGAGSRN